MGSAGCRSDNAGLAASNSSTAPHEVVLTPARQDTLGSTVSGNGTLAADEEANVSFKVPGRISRLGVDLGTIVQAGDQIATLDTTDYQLKVSQAEGALQQARARLGLDPTGKHDTVELERTGTVRQANAVLDEAKANRERGMSLYKSGVISKAQLDAYESAFQVAEGRYQDAVEEVRNRQALLTQRRSEVEIARQQLTDAVLRAPFDGAIAERSSAVGDYVQPERRSQSLFASIRSGSGLSSPSGKRSACSSASRFEFAPTAQSKTLQAASPV